MLDRNQIIANTRNVASQYPLISRITLFGSYAAGTATENSDLDFLVDTDTGFSLFGYGRLQQDLEAIFGIPVDVISAKSHFTIPLSIPESEKVVVYERA